jgi:hypothetical protein
MEIQEAQRWLVPFTWGVDMQAVDAIVSLAEGGGATLVAVSLMTRPDRPGSREPRLEAIQQSKDFLEAIRTKAEKSVVPLERYEVVTVDVMQSITQLTQELHCEAVVLVSRGEREALLRASQLKHALAEPPAALLVLRLAVLPQRSARSAWAQFLIRLWHRISHRVEHPEGEEAKDSLPPEEPLWIRTEDFRKGMSL